MFENLPGWELYSKIIQQKCFDCIDENSKVLEIGPGHGSFTQLILDKNPKFLELVEPNDICYNNIKIRFGNCSNVNIKKQDICETLSTYQKKEFDVVVAFGVLYHWASPFDFLEKIVNYIEPEYFCLDNPDNDQVRIKHETENTAGNRHVFNYRTVKLSIHLPPDIISTAMMNIGYKQLLKRQMKYHNLTPSKQQSWVWKFKLNNY